MPTFAFTTLWGEMLQAKLGEDGEKRLEELAEKVNACLTTDEHIVEGKDEELDRALAEYARRSPQSPAPRSRAPTCC